MTYFDIFYSVGKLWFPFIKYVREVPGVGGLDFGAPLSSEQDAEAPCMDNITEGTGALLV